MSNLLLLAGLAREHGNGFLALSADQNILLPLQKESDRPLLQQRLKSAGLLNDLAENRIRFRVCPGNHECRMGLSPTRDVARQICQALGDKQPTGTLAISGCSNGCSQPQLAALGIITRKSVKQEDGTRTPLFDLLRRSGAGFGEIIQENLDLSGLLAAIAQESQ